MGDQTPPPQTNVIIEQSDRGPGCLVQALWFLALGWWLSGIWISIAWLLFIPVVTMPLGLMMINRVPKIATLADPSREFSAVTEGTATRIQQTERPQHPLWLRAIYFVAVGWWLSGLWLAAAWTVGVIAMAMIVLVITAPVGVVIVPVTTWMYNQVPAITTLKRY